jgi:hypothetical protein
MKDLDDGFGTAVGVFAPAIAAVKLAKMLILPII